MEIFCAAGLPVSLQHRHSHAFRVVGTRQSGIPACLQSQGRQQAGEHFVYKNGELCDVVVGHGHFTSKWDDPSAGGSSSCLLGARRKSLPLPWLTRPPEKIWALMTNGERYRERTVTLP